MGAVAAYNSSFLVTSPPSVSFTNEAMTDSGDHTTYTITNSAHRYLDPTVAVVVQTSPDGTTWTTVSLSTYTLRYAGAIVIFNSANVSGTQLRLQSGKYMPYSTLGNAYMAEFSGKTDMEDTTVFNTTGGHNFTPCLISGTLKCSQWWINETLLTNLTGRSLLAVSWVSPTGARYEGFCYVSDSDLKADVKKVLGEDLVFQLTNQFFAN